MDSPSKLIFPETLCSPCKISMRQESKAHISHPASAHLENRLVTLIGRAVNLARLQCAVESLPNIRRSLNLMERSTPGVVGYFHQSSALQPPTRNSSPGCSNRRWGVSGKSLPVIRLSSIRMLDFTLCATRF